MKLIVQNLAIEYQDQGSGEVLLFLHGWRDNLQTFDFLTEKLSQNWRVIRLDLPGFGKSEMPKNDWTLDDYVNFVQHFTNKLNLKVNAYVGHSFGGRIIIKGLAKNKLLSKKVVLIGSAGIAKNKSLRNFSILIVSKIAKIITFIPPFIFFREQLKRKMYHYLQSDYYESNQLKQTYQNIISEDLQKAAEKIHLPTLLIWGENDKATPITDAKKFANLIKNSKLTIIPNSGHFVHQEKVAEIYEEIRKFL